MLVGTAGTVTTLAAIKLRMDVYDGLRINNMTLLPEELHLLLHHLDPLSDNQREQLPGLEKGRGDLILPGIRIVLGIFEHFQKDLLKVSDFGFAGRGCFLPWPGNSLYPEGLFDASYWPQENVKFDPLSPKIKSIDSLLHADGENFPWLSNFIAMNSQSLSMP